MFSPIRLNPCISKKATIIPKEKIIGYVRVGLDKTILTTGDKIRLSEGFDVGLDYLLSQEPSLFMSLSRRVSMPLIKLTENVRMFGIEGTAEKIELESDDEIGKLAGAFNKMAEDLRRREYEKKALEEELINAKKMEALGTLSRGIAHDFNNILSTIQGASFILKKKLGENSPLQQYVKKIYSSLERADNLIQSLLTFSRGQDNTPCAC